MHDMIYNHFSKNAIHTIQIITGGDLLMSVKTIDVAYDYLKTQNHSISFRDLWKKVVDEMGYDEAQAKKKISQFYTDLSLDSRFTPLQNNVWDLKSNHKLSEVLFDSSALLDESDDEDAPIIEDYDDVDVNDDDRRVDLDSLD